MLGDGGAAPSRLGSRELRILRSKCARIVEAPDVDRDHLGRHFGRSEKQAAAVWAEVADRTFAAAAFNREVSTMCYLPAQNTPERECWYINMGAVDKNFCTVQAMTQAAP